MSGTRTRIACILLTAACHASTMARADVAGPITEINGQRPPGALLPLQDTSVMLDTIDSTGKRVVVTKGTRKAGTRVGIHIHKHGGHTCVLT